MDICFPIRFFLSWPCAFERQAGRCFDGGRRKQRDRFDTGVATALGAKPVTSVASLRRMDRPPLGPVGGAVRAGIDINKLVRGQA